MRIILGNDLELIRKTGLMMELHDQRNYSRSNRSEYISPYQK